MSEARVSAVLVNYNAGDELQQALQSIADDMGATPWEAVVIDNASTDDSLDTVAAFAPAARAIRNPFNVGFATAVNQGLAASSAPLVLIMNPDCRLVSGAIRTLEGVLDRDPRCAIAGPQI